MGSFPARLAPSQVRETRAVRRLPWHLEHVGLDALAGRGLQGKGILVAVIDTGIDVTMPTFDRVRGQITAVDRHGDENGDDHDGHGTAMAALLVGDGIAVCPDARVLGIRAFSGTGGSTAAWLADGIAIAVKARAHVISISGGQPDSDAALAAAVAAASDAGAVVVAAADNSRPYAPLYPACIPPVIAVTASDARDRLVNSAPPGWIDVAAPGVDVDTVTWDQAAKRSGTSEATVIVAGVCALLLGAVGVAQRRKLAPHLLAILQSTATPATNGTGPGDCGVIHPARALAALGPWQ